MSVAPSFQDLYDLGKAEALVRRPDLSVAEGDVSDMFLAGAAAMADRLIGWAADRIRATYLDGASGDDLTTLADDHWSVQRRFAVQAVGQVTFNRATAAAGAGTIAAGSLVATQRDANGQEVRYYTDSSVSYGAAETGNKTVNCTAEFGGKAGNVAAAKVTRIVTNQWDTSLTVTNASPMAGGAEAETDDQLRDRVRGLLTTLRRGTLKALEVGALQVETVQVATVVEETDGNLVPTGIVTVYISDASGSSNPTMINDVKAELENWRAAGSVVNVVGGTLLIQPVVIQLTVKAGVNTNSLVDDVKAAIVARLDRLGIGERLYVTNIRSAAIAVDPDNILEVAVVTPAVDVQPAGNQLLRTTLADITVT